LSGHFIDGGVTGKSMLLADTTVLPISVLIFSINITFVFIGYRRLGAAFAIRSALAII
jgi:uncharacterized membrane-anchored protein YitT (DUF2179 family)